MGFIVVCRPNTENNAKIFFALLFFELGLLYNYESPYNCDKPEVSFSQCAFEFF